LIFAVLVVSFLRAVLSCAQRCTETMVNVAGERKVYNFFYKIWFLCRNYCLSSCKNEYSDHGDAMWCIGRISQTEHMRCLLIKI